MLGHQRDAGTLYICTCHSHVSARSRKVNIRNQTSWHAFMSKAAQELCSTLGIKAVPKWELHSMVLYDTGSRYVDMHSTPSLHSHVA